MITILKKGVLENFKSELLIYSRTYSESTINNQKYISQKVPLQRIYVPHG